MVSAFDCSTTWRRSEFPQGIGNAFDFAASASKIASSFDRGFGPCTDRTPHSLTTLDRDGGNLLQLLGDA
eukprot:697655-Amphidinium_carterae.1